MIRFEKLCEDNFVFKTILTRRSIRNFQDRDVDDNSLRALIQAAQWSPSAWDTQTWRFIIVRDKNTRLSIAKAAFKIIKNKKNVAIKFEEHKEFLGTDAPLQIFICNDTREITDKRIKEASIINCFAAIQTILLADQSIGLGACWQGDPLLAKDEVKRLLNIPDDIEPISSIALGYPLKEPNLPKRKHNLDEILFIEKM